MLMRSTTRLMRFVITSLAIVLTSGSVRPDFLAATRTKGVVHFRWQATTNG